MTKQTLYYFSYPKSTRVLVKETRPLPFPAVTICNLNLYKKSAMVNETFVRQLLRDTFSGRPPTLNLSDPDVVAKGADINMAEFAKKSSYTLEDMFVDCKWQGQKVPCKDYFLPTLTQMGQCYTFHSIKHIAQTNVTLGTYGTGSSRGLYVRLNVKHDEYSYGLSSAAGFKVLHL